MTNLSYCYSFGDNTDGQCGHKVKKTKEKNIINKPLLIQNQDFVIDLVVPLENKTLFVNKRGSIIKIGKNGKRVFNMGEERIVSCSHGKKHCLFLMFSGNIYGYGSNSEGQMGVLAPQYFPKVTELKIFYQMDVEVIQVACSMYTSFFLCKNGELYACGGNEKGEVGMNSRAKKQITPFQLPLNHVRKVFTGSSANYAFAITADYKLYRWGNVPTEIITRFNFESGHPFNGGFSLKPVPYTIKLLDKIRTIACNPQEYKILYKNGYYFSSMNTTKNHKKVVKWITASSHNFLYLYKDNEIKCGNILKLDLIKPMHSLRVVAGPASYFIHTWRRLSVLATDFLQLFNKKIFTDCELNGIKCHKALLEIRTGASFDIFPEILKNYSKEETMELLHWVYSDFTSNFDLVEGIIKKLQSKEVPSIHTLNHDLFRLLNSPKTSDFVLIVDQVEIPIHRFVLCARSELFHTTFKFENKGNKVFDFSGKSLDSIKILIRYFYTEKLIFDDEKLDSVYPELEDAMDYYHINQTSNYLYQLEMEKQRITIIREEKEKKLQLEIEKVKKFSSQN
ncbi:btk-binding protein-related [Anaeramoeba flamelloides]|uniref:Btk-binding protein-related n=1 Tax=Anaeramoeba flamelloides TaxID=1746091 RepID=A0AAV7Z392_9EUKA|nr:btk-binding protein-related [Anaeramoeba flamelloides]